MLFGLLCKTAFSQTLDDAKKWYLEGQYADALPVFQSEYQNSPKDASLNQWLGVSLYKTGRLLEAEQYLAYASAKKVIEAYIYLGELKATLYQFEEAEKEFEKYERANRRNDTALERLEQVRDYADKLKRAVSRTEDVQIIDSLVIPKQQLLSAYNLSVSSGRVMPASDFFNSLPVTNKTLYINEKKDKIYYSKDDPKNRSELYTMERLIDSFGNEKRLPESINNSGNQAYPFVMNDGLTIYFAATGDNSFGGYDLYVSRYNLASDSYLLPNQLNMPFNSPFNDYLMVIDEDKGVGWFASDRFQPENMVCVYTFIPNEKVSLLENNDPAYIANRAKISSIADTWREGVDYSSISATAHQISISDEQADSDFEFIINDRITYRTLSDFKSSKAQSMFSQAIGLEQQLQALKKDLALKREQFGTEKNRDSALRASIIDQEQRLATMFKDIEKLKIQARNEEINSNF